MSTETLETRAEEFDPEQHATDDQGQPVMTREGRYAKKRGPKSAPASSGPAGRVASPRRAKKASAPRSSATARSKAPDYRPGILGMMQLAAAPLAFRAPLDSLAVVTHAPNIAEALNDLAQERPEVAAVLQRVMQVGPYGVLVAAVAPMVVQILHNHDLIPEQAAVNLGASPKSELQAALGLADAVDRAAETGEPQPVPGVPGHSAQFVPPMPPPFSDNVVAAPASGGVV